MSSLNDQVGGTHYREMAIQPAEFNEKNGLPFNDGQVVKYVSRHESKGKAADILKAVHFLLMILEWRYGWSVSTKAILSAIREGEPSRTPTPEVPHVTLPDLVYRQPIPLSARDAPPSS